jgi:hypothetical protein
MPITLSAQGYNNAVSDKNGWEYIKHVEWEESYVTHIDFTLDADRYTNYILSYSIVNRHNQSSLHYNNPSDHFNGAYVTFLRNSAVEGAMDGFGDDITNSYNSVYKTSNQYAATTSTTPSWTHHQGDTLNKIWLGAGDGSYWCGQGMALISIPPYSNYDNTSSRACLRSLGGLTADNPSSSKEAYWMDGSGTYARDDTKSWQIRGIRIVCNGHPSKFITRKGWILLQGVRR